MHSKASVVVFCLRFDVRRGGFLFHCFLVFPQEDLYRLHNRYGVLYACGAADGKETEIIDRVFFFRAFERIPQLLKDRSVFASLGIKPEEAESPLGVRRFESNDPEIVCFKERVAQSAG